MAKSHIIFVINAKAGTTEKSMLPDLIRQKGDELQFDHTIYTTTGDDDIGKLTRLMQELNPTMIAAAGGDGTCNMVARVVMNTPVKMGIIPAGSANGMARELNIPLDFPAAIDLLVKGVVRTIDVVKVNDNFYSIHLADVGLNAKIIRRFEQEKVRGLWGYARQLWRELFYLKHYHFELEIDGSKFHRTAISITFANSARFGTGAVINPEADLSDGKFEVCIIRPFPVYYLLTLAIKFFRGTINNSKYVHIVSCREAIVRTRKKITLQVDGEIIGYVKEVKAQLIPSAVAVMVPGEPA